ncbi:MAG: LapA family protein [Acidimicrobiales bacterium]
MTDGTDTSVESKPTTTVSPKMIVGLVVATLVLSFVFQNTDEGRVHLLIWDIRTPAWLWLVTGVVVGSLFP